VALKGQWPPDVVVQMHGTGGRQCQSPTVPLRSWAVRAGRSDGSRARDRPSPRVCVRERLSSGMGVGLHVHIPPHTAHVSYLRLSVTCIRPLSTPMVGETRAYQPQPGPRILLQWHVIWWTRTVGGTISTAGECRVCASCPVVLSASIWMKLSSSYETLCLLIINAVSYIIKYDDGSSHLIKIKL
jgi:hypothetical protein